MQYISKIMRAADFLVIVLNYTPCVKVLINYHVACEMQLYFCISCLAIAPE